jgi:hypothetical protein
MENNWSSGGKYTPPTRRLETNGGANKGVGVVKTTS